jgi:hypothetical protein
MIDLFDAAESAIKSYLEPLIALWEKVKHTTVLDMQLGQLLLSQRETDSPSLRLRQIAHLPALGRENPRGIRLLQASVSWIASGKTDSLRTIRSLRDEE